MYYANYMLNMKVKAQTQAFVEGLQMVIRKDHLSIFFSDEIQLLISGGVEAEIDVEDLKKYTQYNGYTAKDPYIEEFWKIVKSLSPNEKEKLL